MSLTQKGQDAKQMLHFYWRHCTIICKFWKNKTAFPFHSTAWNLLVCFSEGLFSAWTPLLAALTLWTASDPLSVAQSAPDQSSHRVQTNTPLTYITMYLKQHTKTRFLQSCPCTNHKQETKTGFSVLFVTEVPLEHFQLPCVLPAKLSSLHCEGFSSLWRKDTHLILYGYINCKVLVCWWVMGAYLPLLSGAVL